jgi:hypothetical protein
VNGNDTVLVKMGYQMSEGLGESAKGKDPLDLGDSIGGAIELMNSKRVGVLFRVHCDGRFALQLAARYQI